MRLLMLCVALLRRAAHDPAAHNAADGREAPDEGQGSVRREQLGARHQLRYERHLGGIDGLRRRDGAGR